jgi:probable phosphoglycerate mutase
MTTSKKTIYLIRHGQTDYNLRGIVQGSGIDSVLNEEGHKQSKLFHRSYQHVPFQKIYVSELQRTHQSVAPFVQNGQQLTILPDLNEINWGILEGQEPTPEGYQHFLTISKKWRNGDYEAACENGESAQSMFNRQKSALKIIESDDTSPILICMHGRAIRSFLCLLTQTPLSQMDNFGHENLCLYILEKDAYNPENYKIKLTNCTEHLKS